MNYIYTLNKQTMGKYKNAMQEIMTKAQYYIENPHKNPLDVFDYEPTLCGYCGEETDDESTFCSENCWKGYEHETFRKD